MDTHEDVKAKPFIKYPTALAFNSLPVPKAESRDSPKKGGKDDDKLEVAHIEVA